MEPLIRYPIFQHAWFVEDLEETCRCWHKAVGAGPFFIHRNHVTDTHTYRGEPFLTPLHYAFGYHGPTQVQFIQQLDHAPSIYRDMFGPGEEGFHHVAMLVPDAKVKAEAARFEAAGYPVVSDLWSHADVAYVDTRELIGCYLELHGDNDEIRGVFAPWIEAHETWDGQTEPLRFYGD
jgi:hypothetical protein